MNKEQTKEAIAVMQAFLNGKEIEFSDTNGRTWLKHMESQVYWNWANLKYRIKPDTVKYRRYIKKGFDGVKEVDTLTDIPANLSPGDLMDRLGDRFIRWIDTEWKEEIV